MALRPRGPTARSKTMNKYEAMFIVNPDLVEEDKKNLFNQIGESITKNQGQLLDQAVWAEKRKLIFPIKKHHEATYYLVNFMCPPEIIKEIKRIYGLNENILRVMITRPE